MLKKGLLFLVTICVAAEASTFTVTLLRNVNRYKQNNFQWNVRNFGDDKYISLRKLEEEKDREFNEYLQELGTPVYDNALDVVETIQYRDNIQVHDKTDRSLQERDALPRIMSYANKTRSLKALVVHTKRLQPNEKINAMMYSGKRNIPKRMCYACNANLPLEQDIMSKREASDYPRSMQILLYKALEDAPQTMYSNSDRAIEQPGNVMMYAGTSQPQNMMYKRESGDYPQPMQVMLYGGLKDVPQTMMYSNSDRAIEQPGNVMMYAGTSQPQDMMYKRESGDYPQPMQVMLYRGLKNAPQTMMYSNSDRAIEQPGNVMMYAGTSQPQDMMYKRESGDYPQPMQVMLYGGLKNAPQTMMYSNSDRAIEQPGNVMMYAGTSQPQDMMYKRESGDYPQPMQVMLYGGLEDVPQTMMYSNSDRAIEQPGSVMMYAGTSQPQDMMYKRESGDYPQPMQVMLYGGFKNAPQTMMYSNSDRAIEQPGNVMMYAGTSQPQDMMYKRESGDYPQPMQVMLYGGLEDVPQTMMYSNSDRAIEQPGSVMMYAGTSQPQDMMYKRESGSYPHPMMYNGLKQIPQTMLFEKKRKNIISNKDNKQTQSLESHDHRIMFSSNTLYDRKRWYKTVSSLAKNVPKSDEKYFNQWTETIVLFGTNQEARSQFKKSFPALSMDKVIDNLATVTAFENLFWPFVYENGFMNQKLGLLGLMGVSTPVQNLKITFYEALERQQTLKIPVSSNKVILSFNDQGVVDGLNRSGLMETGKPYVDAGLHLYTPEEVMVISRRVNAALHLINATMPQLYKAIGQVVACIAYYKAQHPGFAGGSISSALGLIWQDPRLYREQSVAHYAEQIVHEFIHNSLFLADMVHGTFVNSELTSQAKVYSPIRHELRDFDKTFHASYVSTGVALFHARAGNFEKAKKLLEPLEKSVTGLVEINNKVGVLNESGNAMLQAMVDFLSVIRLM